MVLKDRDLGTGLPGLKPLSLHAARVTLGKLLQLLHLTGLGVKGHSQRRRSVACPWLLADLIGASWPTGHTILGHIGLSRCVRGLRTVTVLLGPSGNRTPGEDFCRL